MVHFRGKRMILLKVTRVERVLFKLVHLGANKRIAYNRKHATEEMFDGEPVSIAL